MYLGIDLGTSAVKLLVVDRDGNILENISKKYSVNYFNSNWAEQNPLDWWNACYEGIKEIKNKSAIKGISFSGQMHGLVLLDSEDRVIRPAIIWCDQRTTRECDTLNNVSFDINEIIGNKVLTGFTSPKLLWIKDNEPENYKRISKIMLPKDFIAYKLTKIFATDYSDASGTALLDVKNKEWSKEILDFLYLTISQLPTLHDSYERIGFIDSKIAIDLGLSSDVGVVIGGGDQAIGAVGVGAVEEGVLSLALGTSGVIFACNDIFERDTKFRLHSFCHANGKFHQMGVVLSASASLKWWVESVNEDINYDEYTKEASLIASGSDNLFFLPYLMGERTPHNDSFAKGTFIGLTPIHTKAHMTRSIIEGVSFALNDTLTLLKDMNFPIDSIRVSGGGAKSDLWKQILADVFGYDIICINSTEGPALGAAILAMVGSGEYKSVEEACSNIIKETQRTTPSQNTAIYKELYNKYTKLYPLIKDAYRVI
jgi:xylulokinase